MTEEKHSEGLLKKIEDFDQKFFFYFYKNKFFKKKIVRRICEVISFFGSIEFWGGLWLIWIIYGYITKDYYLLVLITSGFIQSISVHILIRYKLVRRNRPFVTLKNEGVRQHDELIRESKSFPSGHVAFVLFFGIIFAYYFKDYFWIIFVFLIGFDTLMAICRLILGVHFPTDVIFGFVFGFFYAILYLGVTYPYWVALFYWLGEIFSPIIHFWKH